MTSRDVAKSDRVTSSDGKKVFGYFLISATVRAPKGAKTLKKMSVAVFFVLKCEKLIIPQSRQDVWPYALSHTQLASGNHTPCRPYLRIRP